MRSNISSFPFGPPIHVRIIIPEVATTSSFYIHVYEIEELFPGLFGQPSAMLVPSELAEFPSGLKLKIGVVLSGGQAPGGHNVISGIFRSLQMKQCTGSGVDQLGS
ncbi:Pyrophosphate--fructose 6-phosphate 1-phosphotransferase subunit beta 2 [Camellia lanceoleosa]|nr:Pyrophosphate--fructose 6-phosphate 1-phosphotransferase subunit beta 2 [Camellia lanceoleosa]